MPQPYLRDDQLRNRVPKEERTYIGYYGCSHADRVVWVGAPPGTVGRDLLSLRWLSWKVECTACGRTHVFRPAWVQVSKRERRDRAEQTVYLGAAIRQPRGRNGTSLRKSTV